MVYNNAVYVDLDVIRIGHHDVVDAFQRIAGVVIGRDQLEIQFGAVEGIGMMRSGDGRKFLCNAVERDVGVVDTLAGEVEIVCVLGQTVVVTAEESGTLILLGQLFDQLDCLDCLLAAHTVGAGAHMADWQLRF